MINKRKIVRIAIPAMISFAAGCLFNIRNGSNLLEFSLLVLVCAISVYFCPGPTKKLLALNSVSAFFGVVCINFIAPYVLPFIPDTMKYVVSGAFPVVLLAMILYLALDLNHTSEGD